LAEDFYCAGCFVELTDEMIEELLVEQESARRALRGKSPASLLRWRLVEMRPGAMSTLPLDT
jgi:hypothetical protein